MKRLFAAFQNSCRALVYLLKTEKAVQQEVAVLLIAIPVAIWLSQSMVEFFILIGVIVFVLIVEILNTAVEAACNALTRDFREDIRIAKDAGSLAVLLAILLAAVVWGWAVINTFW